MKWKQCTSLNLHHLYICIFFIANWVWSKKCYRIWHLLKHELQRVRKVMKKMVAVERETKSKISAVVLASIFSTAGSWPWDETKTSLFRPKTITFSKNQAFLWAFRRIWLFVRFSGCFFKNPRISESIFGLLCVCKVTLNGRRLCVYLYVKNQNKQMKNPTASLICNHLKETCK